ncbi:MAG: ester cyclase, partial [Dehalococcoidia bacterium]
ASAQQRQETRMPDNNDGNKAVIRRLYTEALNQGQLGVLDEVYSIDAELHFPGTPEDPYGPGFVRQLFATLRNAFPSIRASVDDLVAEGDKVVARVVFTGHHEGNAAGRSPFGPLSLWTRIDVYRLFQGRIIEQWADRDELGLLGQLGVVPVPVDHSGQPNRTYAAIPGPPGHRE